MPRFLLLLTILIACHPISAAPSEGQASATEHATYESDSGLDSLFRAADERPDGCVDLVLAGSARLVELDGDAGHALADRLEPYCHRLYFSGLRPAGMERAGLALHAVAKGEFPGAIAKRYRIGAGLLPRLNAGFDERRLSVGQTLKVIDLKSGSLRLVVDRARFRLAAWRRDESGRYLLLAYVPVGLGAAQTPTPSGRTRVVERVLDPPWTDPVTHVTYAPRDPGNLLGGYWMRLDDQGIGKKGIGLHGFTGKDPSEWLGRNASNGCVRMLQADIDRVFHLALEGTPVEFVP